jgi:hypothetical protein
MKIEKVRIIKPRSGLWYEDLVGEIFNVVPENGIDLSGYILNESFTYYIIQFYKTQRLRVTMLAAALLRKMLK